MLRETEKSVKEAQNSLELLKKRMSKPGEQMQDTRTNYAQPQQRRMPANNAMDTESSGN
jgi:hypothetical protein